MYNIIFIPRNSINPISQFSCSVVSDSAALWTAVRKASLSITNSWSLLKLMSIESVTPSNYLILCHPLPLLPSIFPSIRVFSNESVLWWLPGGAWNATPRSLPSLERKIRSCQSFSFLGYISTSSMSPCRPWQQRLRWRFNMDFSFPGLTWWQSIRTAQLFKCRGNWVLIKHHSLK